MRAALLPLLVGVVTLSRTNRADRAVIVSRVRLERIPVRLTTVVKLVPSVLVWMLYAPVFQPVFSPPRPACLMTKLDTSCVEPRSTCRNSCAVSEHHLLLLARLPSTAIAPLSLAAHTAEEVVGLPRARLVPRLGAAGGGVNPSLNDGGASAVPVPLAVMVTLPPGRCTRIDGNDGPCSARVSAPGVAGYMPSADHTYHADVAPRSSLPGRPPAEVLNPSVCTLCTASAVPAGLPAKLYAHGTPCSVSLPL